MPSQVPLRHRPYDYQPLGARRFLVFLFLSLCVVLFTGYCLVRETNDPSVLKGLAELVKAVGSLVALPGLSRAGFDGHHQATED